MEFNINYLYFAILYFALNALMMYYVRRRRARQTIMRDAKRK